MTSIDGVELQTEIERVDDIPVIYGLLKRVGIQVVIDQAIRENGNWQGLRCRVGHHHLAALHIERKEPSDGASTVMDENAHDAAETADESTGGRVGYDDDRLALCLFYLHKQATWVAIKKELGIRTIRIYVLSAERIRLDATVGTVYHDPSKHALFKVGKAKNRLYETQFKLMLASLDALGLMPGL